MRNYRKIRSSCWALVISGNKLKERRIKFVEGLNKNYEFSENCEKS